MQHLIRPFDGDPHLPAQEAIRRIRAEFEHVEIQREQAQHDAFEQIMLLYAQKMEDLGAINDYLPVFESLCRTALTGHHVSLGLSAEQNDSETLRFLLSDDDMLFTGFLCEATMIATATLRSRLAAVLGYENVCG